MEKQPNLSWAHRTDLTVATSPELIPHQNLQSAGHRLAIGAEYMEKEPNLPWALRTDLTVATSPELIPHQNLASVEWDSASSPCADEMQTDSPSNIRTPVPEGRSGMEMDTSPMPPAPRSPWKKPRRGSEQDLRFDDDYDADLIWTSGENFKFEPTGSGSDRCGSPTVLSGESRLSLGMLDLSGASDLSGRGSDCSFVSPAGEERLDASAISTHATVHSTNTTVQCADCNASRSPSGAHQNRRVKPACGPSPGRILDNSLANSITNSSLNMSQMPTAAALRVGSGLGKTWEEDMRPNLNTSGSPLHPQRLFNPGASAGGGLFPLTAISQKSPAHASQNQVRDVLACATPSEDACAPASEAGKRGSAFARKGAGHESNYFVSSLERPARRLSAPLMHGNSGVHSSNPSPGRPRYNPFLPRNLESSSVQRMGFLGDLSMPLTVRSFMDDFCDLKEIGCGSFGRVFSCRRKIDLCLYAVKEINNEFRSERERERLLREIYALSTQGDNVHVVRYFNAWEQDDKLYIQTELCTGSLDDVRRHQGALPEHSLRDILVQVATGLAFMHAHNMAHLDVKPDNIYTTERGIYKLGDLGLASSASPRTHEDEGDKRYLSRELLQQHDNCDLFKADIFALGMTMFEMATGVPVPADGDAYHALRDGRAQMPSHLSQQFQDLLKTLLHAEAAWRPSARDIVRHPLLAGLMRDESIACLRAHPPSQKVQRTSATLMQSAVEPELMASVQGRALKAEKEAARLRAALQAAQHEVAMWRERAKGLEQLRS